MNEPGPERAASVKDCVSLVDVGATLASGALFVLAFPQFGDAWGLDWLIWFCLVPFLSVVTCRGPRAGALLGFCLGMAIEGAGFLWIHHAIASFTRSPPALSSFLFCAWLLYAATIWTLLGWALGSCRSPRGLFWVLPLWVGLEHYYPRLWPWHTGGAVYSREWLLQCVDLLGASGLTAVVFLANTVLVLLVGWRRRRNAFPLASGLVLVALLAGANVYGALRLEDARRFEATRPALEVMLVQGALQIEERRDHGLRIYRERTEEARAARRRRLGEGAAKPVDLVVWPEGAISVEWAEGIGTPFDLTAGVDPWRWFRRRGVSPLALDVPLVGGSTGVVAGRLPEVSNISVFLEPEKEPRFYEKMIRVPFGEVVPGLDLVPESWIRKWGIQVGTLAAGTENPPFLLGETPFKNLCCYEAILPAFCREHALGAEFYVNITEDIWYGQTAQIPQHTSVLILRAVENRMPVVRCCNMGPSGIVGVTGRFDQSEKIFAPEVLFKELRPGRMWSLYRAGGYLFPLVMLLIALSRFVIKVRARARSAPER